MFWKVVEKNECQFLSHPWMNVNFSVNFSVFEYRINVEKQLSGVKKKHCCGIQDGSGQEEETLLLHLVMFRSGVCVCVFATNCCLNVNEHKPSMGKKIWAEICTRCSDGTEINLKCAAADKRVCVCVFSLFSECW